MFNSNIFIKSIENSRKMIAIIVALIIIINIFWNFCAAKNVYAQERQNVSARINNYPGYAELINNLRAAHPNWNFKMFYTGLDWNQVIKNETTAWHGRNLIYSDKTGDWICPTCSDKRYDNGSWRCASEATVSYYMDPRNFLNDDYIFQFEESVFNESIHTVDGIMYKTNGTFLAGRENAEAMIQACRNVNISPYQVVSRLLLEQGSSGSTMSRGNNGWYNVFNVGASGNSSSQIIANATQYAQDNGWNTLAKSILGGIDFLKSKYIGIGQNTIYLQKFDVDSSDGILYYHQYMQNVSAAYTEGQTVREIYRNAGTFNSSISFVIPVYENMPSERSPIPGTQSIVTQNVRINDNYINVRDGKGTDSGVIAELNNGDYVLRIELGNSIENGYKWDKVVLADGRKGYIATNFLTRVDDIKNCNDSVIANTSVNLRNGPGTNGTAVITTLTPGQAMTRIETGVYNGIDGYNWDRVVLSDGRQGYIVREFIDLAGSNSQTSNSSGELVKVVTSIGITVRETPGTDKRVLTYISYNEIVTRVEAGVSTANGYTWDKIVTGSGVVGYIARGNSSENFIESIGGNSNSIDYNTNNNFKVDGDKIITEPNTNVDKIKEKYPNAKVTNNGQEVTGTIGTGNVINIDGKEYTILKLGDSTGDGIANSWDALEALKQSVNLIDKQGIYLQALDVDKNGKVDSNDAKVILKYSVNLIEIDL